MSRPKLTNTELPRRVRRKGNAFYYVEGGKPRKWVPLGGDLTVAIEKAKALAGQDLTGPLPDKKVCLDRRAFATAEEAEREYLRRWRQHPESKRLRTDYVAHYLSSEAGKARYRAHAMLFRAVRDGVIQKMPCWVCGADGAEGHHPDYSEPLSVVWLCRFHHAQTHAMADELLKKMEKPPQGPLTSA